ncbi:hypothetical protein [Sphingomonas sp. R86520]|uniref:hypothetical protein n=1 Tax=Sphingomonas sp. R86520 TaxID=3093859 RepID=UPI0036D2B44E
MTAAARTNVVPLRAVPDMDAAYRAAVSIHYPNCDPLSMATRVEIMGLRDRASAALRRANPEAQFILAEAARIATLASLSSADPQSLAFTRVAIESLIFSADMMRRAYA